MTYLKLKWEILKAQIRWASRCFASWSPTSTLPRAYWETYSVLHTTCWFLHIFGVRKRPSTFYKLNFERKKGGMAKCLENKPWNDVIIGRIHNTGIASARYYFKTKNSRNQYIHISEVTDMYTPVQFLRKKIGKILSTTTIMKMWCFNQRSPHSI